MSESARPRRRLDRRPDDPGRRRPPRVRHARSSPRVRGPARRRDRLAAKRTETTESVEIVDRDGRQRRLWGCEAWFAERGLAGECGSNGLTWHPASDTFLLSLWSTDTVVEIDAVTGATIRWFGGMDGWGFEPPESGFFWQHGPVFTESGTLLLSCLHHQRYLETVAREYALDPTTETLTEVWSFGEGRGNLGANMGEAHRLPNGNTLHVYGSGGRMIEATPSGEVAWEVSWEGGKHNGRTTALGDLYPLVSEP